MLLAIIGIGSLTVSADNTTSGTCGDNLTWEYDENSRTLTISGTGAMSDYSNQDISNYHFVTTAPWRPYYSSMKSVIINKGVNSIGKSAFYGCNLSSIIIPDSVSSIGGCAFEYCTNLTSVTIPNSVTSIGTCVFEYCSVLTSITIPDSVTSIGDSAFYHCASLTSIIIPDSVTSIVDYAFSGCPLEYVKMGKGLTSIPSSLINKSLKEFIIGSSVTSIDNYAFNKCTKLTSITIPDSVTSIGNGAFYDCTGLTSVTIGNSVTNILSSTFENCPLEYVKMGNGLTIIPSELIKKDYLKTLIIGENVTSIDGSAFSGCTGLTSITIPDSVTNIGWKAFSGCTELTKVNYTGTVEDWCKIKKYSNPVEYSHNLYINNTLLTEINEEDLSGFTSIESATFKDCTCLTSITIPDSVTSIGDYAFSGCPLEYVKMGSGLTTIPSTLINKDSLKTFIIGENVTTISGFSDCKGLTSITIPNIVTSIGNSAFSGCTGLTSVTIPDSVTSIGGSAFSNCSGLTSVKIGNGVTIINNSAFSGCTSLATITLPAGITKIGYDAFNNTAYYNNASNWSDNMLYIGNYLIKGKTDLAGNKSVKSNTTCIADSALSGCNKIITLTVPDSVNYIGSNAFGNVTNVAYTGTATGSPWGAKCLNGYADGNLVYKDSAKAKLVTCSGLATGSVIIPASTDTIGDNAFSACSLLTTVYLPVNVTRIGTSAFGGTALSDVYYEGGATDKLVLSIADNNTKLDEATWHYNSKVTDMPQNAVYSLSYNANGGSGAPGNQTGSGYVSISNSTPSRSGYTFLGWAESAGATSAKYGAGSLFNLDKDITLYAVWQKNETPENPDNPTNPTNPTNPDNPSNPTNPTNPTNPSNPDNPTNPSNPDNPSNPGKTDASKAVITAPSGNKQINWKYKAQLVASASNLPEGCKVVWYEGNKPVSDGANFTTGSLTESHTYTAKIVDAGGKVVSTSAQEKTVTVEVKTDFFSKIISFFMRLFGSDVTKL